MVSRAGLRGSCEPNASTPGARCPRRYAGLEVIRESSSSHSDNVFVSTRRSRSNLAGTELGAGKRSEEAAPLPVCGIQAVANPKKGATVTQKSIRN